MQFRVNISYHAHSYIESWNLECMAQLMQQTWKTSMCQLATYLMQRPHVYHMLHTLENSFLCASYEINKYLQVLKQFSSHCSIWLVCYILPDLLHQYLWRIVQVEFYAVKGTRTHSVCNVKMLEWIFMAQHNLTASFLWYSKNICMCCTKFKWHLCTICHPT